MKKSILYILCITFLFASDLSAMVIMHGSGVCPPFYADTNVLFSWDGNSSMGVNYGCTSAGVPVLGTNNNLGISAAYGESGNGALLDTLDEYLRWSDDGTIIDDTGARTIFVRVKELSQCTNDGPIFEAVEDGNNYIYIVATGTNPNVRGNFEGQGHPQNAIGTNGMTTLNTWVTTGYTWDTPAGEGTPTGDHATRNQVPGWEQDANELGYVFANYASEFGIGEKQHGSACAEAIYIDKFVIMSGYQASPPANW